ncbi:uridine monophosphate synthetase [Geosmithia morbida]|uniref:Orotidine 5'-phosphate decarboxylase n=1 Tax=Geosmithia morbida TaxID=1094350 RepID=A0A9P4Z4B9_9HYPO|nr:uridine monophosphate synthetase [Geosmithia morbida]KAF4126404.1 uridine monophosphate synthetase [Geosmithia morbida]
MATPHPTLKMTYAQRSEATTHPLTAYLFKLMDLKASNLCLSADVPTARELLYLADKIGPSIVVLKTHHDMVAGWDYDQETGTGAKLSALARRHGFLIFEDRKFGDIGNTVELQYTSGSARIIDWAHITNVNMVPGKASVTSLANAAARWLERIPYQVKTSVTVGTPRMEGEEFDDEEGDSNNNNNNNNNSNKDERDGKNDKDDCHLQSPDNNSNILQFNGDGNGKQPQPGEGRKGSIVSITTLTQQYEPAHSPRLHQAISEEEGALLHGIEEAPLNRGLLILAQMSSKGNFMNAEYTQACVEAAREHKDFVMGFVSQEALNTLPEDDFIHMTPGCQLPPEHDEDGNPDEGQQQQQAMGDGKGQQYNTPGKLIGICGADIAIVGRGIIKAGDPEHEADRYRSAAWKAYTERVR